MDLRSYSNNNVQILAPSGRFDVTTAPSVRDWIEEAVTKEPPFLVVNLADVEFMDSTGLSTLVHGMKRSRERNGDLHLCNLQQPVRIIFELTRLAQWFEIYIGEEEAIAAFEESGQA
ncbi:MAG: STAS domain-containing protein [Candidatus Promineifilaceae bacterium]